MPIDEPATLGRDYTEIEIRRAKEKRREFSKFVSTGCEFLHGLVCTPAANSTNEAAGSSLV